MTSNLSEILALVRAVETDDPSRSQLSHLSICSKAVYDLLAEWYGVPADCNWHHKLQGRILLQRVPVETCRAYVPDPLPPNPPILLDPALTDILERANRAIGQLDGLSVLIPDISRFIYYYVRK